MRLISGVRLKLSHLGLKYIFKKIWQRLKSGGLKNLVYSLRLEISNLRGSSIRLNDLSRLLEEFTPVEGEIVHRVLKKNELLIVIPIFNGLEMSKKCLESVLESEPEAEVYAIDDCSTDEQIPDMLAKISAKFPTRFKWERNPVNLGFVKNANKGLAYANGRHVVLVNSDTVCTPKFASIMCLAFTANLKIASVTPMTNAGEIANTPSIFSEAPQLDDSFAFIAADLVSRLTSYQDVKSWPEIPTGVGFAMAINGDALTKIGLFDEIFSPGYGEENDWCIRAKSLGYRNLLCPIAYVHHNHGSSFGDRKPALVKKNLEILNAKYPFYNNEIRKFQTKDPLHYFRHWLFLSALAISAKFEIRVVIDHLRGGGATATLKNEINEQLNTLQVVIYKLTPKSVEFEIIFGPGTVLGYQGNLEDFIKFIKILKPSKCLINSTPFVSENSNIFFDFMTDLTNSIASVEMRIHDYHALCPSYNLISSNGTYCDLPAVETCNNCFQSNELIPPFKHSSITEWRSGWSEIIRNVDQLTGYSSESLTRFKRVHDVSLDRQVQTKHHVVDQSRALKRIMQTDIFNLRIATVGNLNHAKGSDEVVKLAKAISKMNRNHLICHFGGLSGGVPVGLPISGTGEYRDSRDLILRLMQHAPDLIFLPSIWPETFHLVSEELQNSEIPILMFRFGAPFERFKGRSNFIFTDYKSGEDLLRFIEKIDFS